MLALIKTIAITLVMFGFLCFAMMAWFLSEDAHYAIGALFAGAIAWFAAIYFLLKIDPKRV